MLKMSWQQRRHHGFGCIVTPGGEQRGTTHRWMKTTSEGYTSSVEANDTHRRQRLRLENKKYEFSFIRFNQHDFLPGETLLEFSELVTDHEGG